MFHFQHISFLSLTRKTNDISYVWDIYSDEQKINLVRKFFYWRELSYIEMIHSNFPKMMNYFKTAKDYPYRYKVTITLKTGRNDINSMPGISYYYLCCTERPRSRAGNYSQ